ncbi:MAG: hypothetical protein ACTS5A_03750, partial [Candidatus Hodgkinia cicadicola]
QNKWKLRRTSFEGLKSFGTEVNDLDGAQLCSLITNAQSCFGKRMKGWLFGAGLEGEFSDTNRRLGW